MSQETMMSTNTQDLPLNLNSQNRSYAELLKELGKSWLKTGFIPIQSTSDLPERLESNDKFDKTSLTVVFNHSDSEDINKAIAKYEETLKSKTIIIQMINTWFNKCDANVGMNVDLLPILFVQPSEKLEVRTSVCYFDEYKNENNNVAERICNELISENQDSKTILLLFGAEDAGDDLAQEILKLAKTKLKPKTYNVLGARCDDIIKDISSDCYQSAICFGLTISSSDIETWSFINSDCYINYSELESDLLSFKKRIKLKSQNLGLVIGPSELMDDAEMLGMENEEPALTDDLYMKLIKDIFQNVRFIGAFTYGCDNIYTSSPNSGACSDIFVCGKIISLLIISYD